MTWPTVAVNTSNLDSSSDSPSAARADLLDMVGKVNQMISVMPIGRIVSVKQYETAGTFTYSRTNADVRRQMLFVVGAGGGSAYRGATSSTQVSIGQHGCPGGGILLLTGSDIHGATIVVGAGGGAGVAALTTGRAGGDTSVSWAAKQVKAKGGRGGISLTQTVSSYPFRLTMVQDNSLLTAATGLDSSDQWLSDFFTPSWDVVGTTPASVPTAVVMSSSLAYIPAPRNPPKLWGTESRHDGIWVVPGDLYLQQSPHAGAPGCGVINMPSQPQADGLPGNDGVVFIFELS